MNENDFEQDRKKVEERTRRMLLGLEMLFAGQGFGFKFMVLGDHYHAIIRVRNDSEAGVDIDILPAQLTEGTNPRFIKENFPITMGWEAATYLAQADLNSAYIKRNMFYRTRCFVP
ncbi:MAG: hypothetical protein NT076_03100 [Candidatus Pacearchaeota archaeon]|nr:hypothetical protein [Candidatus Pacearchaeota archaeon]